MTSTIFEILMIVAFGFAWPNNIYKSIKARTAKGTSFLFLLIVLFGYVCGITGKFIQTDKLSSIQQMALVFYFINAAMVITNMVFYIRNALLDKKRDKEAAALKHEDAYTVSQTPSENK